MKKFLAPIALFGLLLCSCSKNSSKPTTPSVTTTTVENVTDSTALLAGDVTNTGNAPILTSGFEYDTSNYFRTEKTVYTSSGTTSFSQNIDSLFAGTTYYVRAFATNDVGNTFGNTVQFTTGTPPSEFTVSTYAGNGIDQTLNGPALQASFQNPVGVAIDPSGVVYVTTGAGTTNSGLIQRIGTDGTVSTLASAGEGGSDIVLDPSGNAYVIDIDKILYKISPTGVVTILAGDGTNNAKDGQGTNASFYNMQSLDMDKNGNLFITDGYYIRRVTPSGYVSTIPLRAKTRFIGIAVDASDNIYVSDGSNILKTDTLGNDIVVAGSDQGFGSSILEIRLDHNGNLIVSDNNHYQIKKLTPSGIATLVAGSGAKGDRDGTASTATFNNVTGITIDASNNIIVADAYAYKIRKITRN